MKRPLLVAAKTLDPLRAKALTVVLADKPVLGTCTEAGLAYLTRAQLRYNQRRGELCKHQLKSFMSMACCGLSNRFNCRKALAPQLSFCHETKQRRIQPRSWPKSLPSQKRASLIPFQARIM